MKTSTQTSQLKRWNKNTSQQKQRELQMWNERDVVVVLEQQQQKKKTSLSTYATREKVRKAPQTAGDLSLADFFFAPAVIYS